MPILKSYASIALMLTLSACATTPAENDPTKDLGILWVKHSAEYQAQALIDWERTQRGR